MASPRYLSPLYQQLYSGFLPQVLKWQLPALSKKRKSKLENVRKLISSGKERKIHSEICQGLLKQPTTTAYFLGTKIAAINATFSLQTSPANLVMEKVAEYSPGSHITQCVLSAIEAWT